MSLPPIFTAASARAAGLTRAQLRGSAFVRLSHDLVVRLEDAIDARERLRLVASVLPPDAAFSHLTAAMVMGASVDAPARAHVALRPRRVLPQRAEFIMHARLLDDEDVIEHEGLRITSGPQTFLDLAQHLPPAELVAVGDALMRRGHLTSVALTERLVRAHRIRGVARARETAPLLSPLTMSRPESLLRYWLTVSDLPDPPPQVPILDSRGREAAHADLGYEEWKVALEYEGRQHAEAEQFGRDMDRYSLMGAAGWLVLRFAHRQLTQWRWWSAPLAPCSAGAGGADRVDHRQLAVRRADGGSQLPMITSESDRSRRSGTLGEARRGSSGSVIDVRVP